MGRRSTGGVEALKETIRLRFTWSGKRRYETLAIKPTPQNMKAAQRLLDQITSEIRTGTFVYARHFPDSPAAQGPSALTTFQTYADQWLKTLTVEPSTRKSYKSALVNVWNPALGQRRLTDIRHSDVKAAVAARRDVVSGKSINNGLIVLRAVFDAAVADRVIQESPARLLKNLKHQSPGPDPLSREEMDKVLGYMRDRYREPVWNYFEFAFMSGLRTSELIALRWASVDFGRRTVRIDTATVVGLSKGTKTSQVRDVDLNDRALAALTRQKAHTFLADGLVFLNPVTGNPWTGDLVQRQRWFQPALRKLGIRQRTAYQTRHTFATLALMAGVNPAYIARQLGHSTTAMLFKHYARWIDGADRGREADKMNRAMTNSGHEMATEAGGKS